MAVCKFNVGNSEHLHPLFHTNLPTFPFRLDTDRVVQSLRSPYPYDHPILVSQYHESVASSIQTKRHCDHTSMRFQS